MYNVTIKLYPISEVQRNGNKTSWRKEILAGWKDGKNEENRLFALGMAAAGGYVDDSCEAKITTKRQKFCMDRVILTAKAPSGSKEKNYPENRLGHSSRTSDYGAGGLLCKEYMERVKAQNKLWEIDWVKSPMRLHFLSQRAVGQDGLVDIGCTIRIRSIQASSPDMVYSMPFSCSILWLSQRRSQMYASILEFTLFDLRDGL